MVPNPSAAEDKGSVAFYRFLPRLSLALGIVFVGTRTGFLYGFDANGSKGCSGAPRICSPIWKASIGGLGTVASPTTANGMAYVGDDNGLFYAFDDTASPTVPARLPSFADQCGR